MFKRKLFKRALPFILSVAMMFESLPATAMATESSGAEQMTETEALDEEGGESGSEKESGSEEKSEPVSASEAEAESKTAETDGSEMPESGSSEAEEAKSESGSGSETTEETSGSEPKSEESSGSESEPESESKSEVEEETVGIEEKEADAEETNKKYETEIKIGDKLGVGVDPNTGAEYNIFAGDFEFGRVLEGENAGYKFAAEYKDFVNLGAALVDALKGTYTIETEEGTETRHIIEIRVDDEVLDKDDLNHSIVERLEFTWKGKKADSTAEGAEAYTESIATPTEAGRYMLTITLPEITGLCEKKSVNIFVEIKPAKIRLGFDSMMPGTKLDVKPGTTVEKFVQQVTEDYNLQYTNKTEDKGLFIDKEKAVKKDSFKVTVHESNAGEETVLQPTDTFDASKEYFVHIALELNDAKNYEVEIEDAYGVKVDELQKTRVELETDKAAYSKIYDGNAADLAAIKAETKVFTLDDKDEDLEELKAADETASLVEAGWYRREQADTKDWPKKGKDAISDTTVKYGGNENVGWVYVKLDEAPVNAGDYYVIWKYAGDEGKAYAPAVSKPVTYTVEHAPAAVTIAQEEADLGKMFFKGMNEAEVNKALAQIDYRVNAIDDKGVLTDLNAADSFFGAGYAADGQSPATSYYRPTFKLQRSISEEMKDGAMTKVEDKDRDWRDVKEIDILSDDDHKYEYRVILTGKKAIYDIDGKVAIGVNGDRLEFNITELSTASADQNYLVKVDDETLEKNAKIIPAIANEAEIITKPIVEEFNSKTNSKVKGAGTLGNPAVKIYDENALFADRASYKKAEVYKKGTTESVENDQTEKTYKWRYIPLNIYKTGYLDKNESEKKDFDVDTLGWTSVTDDSYGNTDNEEGALNSMVSNGLYELTIEYKDKTGAYHAEKEKLYFKVEQQQIVIVPGEQIAQDGQQIKAWRDGNSGNAGLDRTLYKVYKIPNNDWEEYKATTDKSALEIVLREDRKNLVELSASAFQVMNLEKGADGKEGTNYVDTKHDVFSQKTDANPDGYTYAVTARYGNDINSNEPITNYTSVKNPEAEAEWEKYHDDPSAIKFLGSQTLYPVINKEVVEKLTKFYDGKALTQADIEGLVTFYSDKEYQTPVTDILNTTSEYDPEKVNVYWQKTTYDEEGNEVFKRFTTENVVWGGDYTLVLRFRGNEKYKPLSVTGEGDKNSGEKYAEWIIYNGNEGGAGQYTTASSEKYQFSIKRVPITITPVLKSETDIKAGDTVDTLLQKELLTTGVLPEDEVYFQHTELAKGVLEKYWEVKKDDKNRPLGWFEYNVVIDENKDIVPGLDENDDFTFHYDDAKYTYNIDKWGGYPAFDGDPALIFQNDDQGAITEVENQYLRYGKKYTVSFEGSGLLSPLAESYEVTYLPASVEVKQRGQGNVQIARETWNNDQVSVDGIINLEETELRSEYNNNGVNGGTYSITPREAIKFYYDAIKAPVGDPKVQKDFTGNLIAYRIFAPTEFEQFKNDDGDKNPGGTLANNFIYKKSIEAAGGSVIDDNWNTAWNEQANAWGHYITVLLPVTAENPDASFQITWEDGYTDTFTLSNAVLETNLQKAVAPKSIKFNGVQTKMAVGETQQLDLSITKKQLGDVISIRYRIAGENTTNNEYISIDPETGVVTACSIGTGKKATTQIEAYPVCMENGKVTPITGKGVKTAKTKITVTNVTAPSIKKIVNNDITADVSFTDAGNGYRREIYVLEAANQSAAKKIKAAEFESRIASVKNGLYKDAGFALNPVFDYTTPENTKVNINGTVVETYNAKTKLITRTIGDNTMRLTDITDQLTPGKAYAVYVRNVSAARTLDDGKQVDLAVNGSVKSFVATKSQVQSLIPHFNVDEETNTPGAKSTVKYLVTGYDEDGTEKFETSINKNAYQVELSAKTAQVSVDGKFWDMEGGNSAAELKDRLKFALPLTKDKQVSYQNPKLTYGIFDTVPSIKDGKFVTEKSKYATISNKGKISLKGVEIDGNVTVYVYVLADNGKVGSAELTIKADASTVTGKKGKLTVGQTKPLAEFLDYKNGKKKVPNYASTGIVISDETIAAAAAAGYKIEDRWTEYKETLGNYNYWDDVTDSWSQDKGPGYGFVSGSTGVDKAPGRHYWYITAVAPNKKFTLNFTDRKPDGTEITVLKPITLSATAIQPVKSLKVAYVDNKSITINFKHVGEPQGFEIAVMDARKSVIEKRYIGASNYDIVKKDAPDYLQKFQNWNLNNRGSWSNSLVYFEKTKNYAYTFESEKLLRQSSYTISVTPVYEGQMPKTVSKKVKTTNIPAARGENVDTKPSGKGGTSINYSVRGKSLDYVVDDEGKYVVDDDGNKVPKTWYSLQMSPYFQAGNIYTMTLAADPDSKNRVTDTLTWKSSNTKVATIKANKGTYTATFKPLKTGITTISVTSKITKKVIARWDVKVKAIGDGDGFGGNYEPALDDNDFYGDFLAVWDPFYEGRLEVLSVSNPLKLKMKAYDRTWVSFTAPTFGKYEFTTTSSTTDIKLYDSKNGNEVDILNDQEAFLEAGQKVYLKVDNTKAEDVTLSVDGTDFARLTIANNSLDSALNVSTSEWVAFTAPEDNYYAFVGETVIEALRQNNQDITEKLDNATVEVNVEDKSITYSGKKLGLKAGETVFIKVNKAGKFWVDFRTSNDATTLTTAKSVPIKIDKDHLGYFVKFIAPKPGTYDFKVTYDKDISTVSMYAANDEKTDFIKNEGANGLVTDINPLNADSDDKKVKTVSVYMKAGETVFFNVKVNSADELKEMKDGKETYKELTAEISVTNADLKELKPGSEESVTKATETANTVKTFSFAIPETKNVKYKINYTGTDNLEYYDTKGRKLNVSESGFYVADGSVYVNGITEKIKPGEVIYIEAKNSDKNNDAKIKITEIKPSAITDKAEPVVSNIDNEFWYTFTAPKTAVYEFGFERENRAADDKDPVHGVSAEFIDDFFVGKNENNVENAVKLMNANEIVMIRVYIPNGGMVGDDKVTTKATLTISERKPDPAEEGKTPVSEIAKADESAYYMFTAKADAAYTFSYDKNKDANGVGLNAIVKLGRNLKDFDEELGSKNLQAGDVIYIKVTAGVDKASGTLTITKEDKKFLESGKAEDFKIEKDAAKKSLEYTFTAPRNTDYSVIVTRKGDKTAPIRVSWEAVNTEANIESGDLEVIQGVGTIVNMEKGATIKVTIASDAASDAEGTIKIQPTTPALDEAVKLDSKVEAKYGENGLYSYVVTEYGRYNFDFTAAENNNIYVWYYKSNYDSVESGALLNKGDIVYIETYTWGASGDDIFAAQSGTLKVEKIDAKNIEADTETDVTIANGKYAYFTFEAKDEHAVYDFANDMKAAEDKAKGKFVGVYNDKTGKKYMNADEEPLDVVPLDKGDKVFIILTADKDNVQFKYTVKKTAVNVLKENADISATIAKDKASEGVTFGFKVQNVGMYMFEISGEKLGVGSMDFGTPLHNQNNEKAEGKGFYVVQKFDKTNQWAQFTVTTSETEKDTPVSVKVTRIVPEKLTADAADVSKTINKGECVYFEFIPTATARYTFTTDNEHVATPFADTVIKKDAKDYNLIKLTVASSSPAENKSEAVKVKVTTVEKSVKEITGSESFKKPAVGGVWYKFKADKDAKYDFTLTNGKDSEAEKQEYAGKLSMYKNINEDTNVKSLTSQYMKAGDTILIKVDTANVPVAKDADLKLVVTPKEVDQLVEVKVSKGGKDKKGFFKVKKDETYNVTVVNKGSIDPETISMEYMDKDNKPVPPVSITVDQSKQLTPAVENETTVTVQFTFESAVANDNVFYIVVEKEEKPKDPVQNPDSGTTTPDPASEA